MENVSVALEVPRSIHSWPRISGIMSVDWAKC